MPTNISWTDETWNVVTGCSKVGSGCRFCFAEALSLRRGCVNRSSWQTTFSAAFASVQGSGPNRRPFDVAWAEDIYGQCKAADVRFFGKQSSAHHPGAPLLIWGREIQEFPEMQP